MITSYTIRVTKVFIDWFKKPFPCPVHWFEKAGTSVFVTTLIFFILLIFKPFGINMITSGTIWFISGYCFITLYIMLFSSLVIPLFFKHFFDPEKWTTGKYLLHILGDYFTISLFSWIYTTTAGHGLIEADTFIKFLWFTFTVALFPVFSIIYIYERIMIRRKLNNVDYLSRQLGKFQQNNSPRLTLRLEAEGKNADILIPTENLICAKSNGNYSMVYYLHLGETRHSLFRIPLSKLEEMVRGDSSIVRCHRSAIVNLHHVTTFTGNARNYYIHINGIDLRINISRSIPVEILEKFRHL
jgi:hypothetical protein